jgi:hypothetical protein
MVPRQDSIGYQKQRFCAHNESDSRIVKEEHVNKQCSDGTHPIKKAYQLGGKTFIIISQEIVDQLCITDDTWFQQEIINDEIVLRIINWNENGGLV